ncbi:MAG: lamin tail domain-containing protein [Kofleriaceae bacterium]
MLRAVVIASLFAACSRDELDTCPVVAPGELVVTEVQGDGDPLNGSWIELFNASGGSIDLEGARIRFRRKDGSSEVPVLVRRPLTVNAGEYIVLGKYLDTDRPAHVDYGFVEDFEDAWLSAAAIDLENCGLRIDLAQYDALPEIGTFSLGTDPPTADANDLATAWCTNATPAGTPGAANPVCP